MAFANAFLGICHSIAHKLGAAFHIPHGLANAALITHVIAYNATDVPFKQVWLNSYRWSASAATLLSKCLRIFFMIAGHLPAVQVPPGKAPLC